MTSVFDVRKTVLQIINEARLKRGLNTVNDITSKETQTALKLFE